MTDFKLDPITGDLDISNGIQVVTSYEDEARQRLNLAIGLNLGEWFAGINYGLPWIRNTGESIEESIRYLLGDKFPDSPAFVASTIDTYIRGLSYISKVTSSYSYDTSTRQFTYNPVIYLEEGGTIALSPLQVNL